MEQRLDYSEGFGMNYCWELVDNEDGTSSVRSKAYKDLYLAKPSPYQMLREFHEKFGAAINQPFSEEQVALRYALIDEECREVKTEFNLAFRDNRKVELTKELADLMYVTIGTAVAFGLPLEEVFTEVHKSNMSKLGDDGKPQFREDGKVLKGPNYKPPNLERFFT